MPMPRTHRPYLAAVDSDHWLEAEMSSSGMCPPDIPRGYRHTAARRQQGAERGAEWGAPSLPI